MITSLREYTTQIAEALGEGWAAKFYEDEAVCSAWRSQTTGPNYQVLFLSNTWAGRGRVYIGGSLPEGTQLPYKEFIPSITVSDAKLAGVVANDIKRRLLPAYTALLEKVLAIKADNDAFKASRESLANQVASAINGRIQGEMVYSGGGWNLQVSGPDSIRIQGHGNYITLDQLKKIVAVCPELFESEVS